MFGRGVVAVALAAGLVTCGPANSASAAGPYNFPVYGIVQPVPMPYAPPVAYSAPAVAWQPAYVVPSYPIFPTVPVVPAYPGAGFAPMTPVAPVAPFVYPGVGPRSVDMRMRMPRYGGFRYRVRVN